jgi:hypothetical protein
MSRATISVCTSHLPWTPLDLRNLCGAITARTSGALPSFVGYGVPPPLGPRGAMSSLASVTEPPKSLGPHTVVLVQHTSDNPAGAPESLDKFGICFLSKSVSPVTQTLQASEIRKCGSSYINLPLLKSKTELYSYRPEHNIYMSAEYYYYKPWEAKPPPDKY